MKAKIMICTLVLMFSAFAGSVFGGTEGISSTAYGLGAGYNASYLYNTFIGSQAGSYNSGDSNTFIGYQTGFAFGSKNTFLGYKAGSSNAVSENTFIGASAGINNTDGSSNTFIGTYSGQSNQTGYNNTFLGYKAGSSNLVSENIFIGVDAGQTNNGNYNIFVGYMAGYNSTSGHDNTFIGTSSGILNTTGGCNTFLGSNAGQASKGDANTIVGALSGTEESNGSYNAFLGYQAGSYNTGSGNVFLGYRAGMEETGSNKLYIANSFTTTPLIWGDFTGASESTGKPTVAINGNLGIGTQAPVRMLHLAGAAVFRMDRTADTAAFQIVRTDISGNPMKVFVVGVNASGTNTGEFIINDNGTALSGALNRRMTIANNGNVTFGNVISPDAKVYAQSFITSSSLTLKDNVRTYENALDTVNRLRGVSFDWKDSGKPSVGLIAEEVEKVVPEVVAYNDGAATGVNYASLVGVLVEAVKEQQVQHQADMDSLKGTQAEVDSLKSEVQQLKALLQGR